MKAPKRKLNELGPEGDKVAINAKEYLEKLATEAGLDADSVKFVSEKLAGNEKFTSKLSNDVSMQSDYNKNMEKLRKEQEKHDKEWKEKSEWYAKTSQDFATAQQTAEAEKQNLIAQLAMYQTNFGTLPGGTPMPQNTDYVSKKDLETMLAQVQAKARDEAIGSSYKLMSEALPLALEHEKKFGKSLDFNQLLEQAKQVQQQPISPIRQAYQSMISDEDRKLSELADQKKLEAARKDWERDFRSKNNIPVDQAPKESHVFFERKQPTEAPKDDFSKARMFADIWEKSAASSASNQ